MPLGKLELQQVVYGDSDIIQLEMKLPTMILTGAGMMAS